MAVQILSTRYPFAVSKYVRVRFYQFGDGEVQSQKEAVWCSDFFAYEIAAEQELEDENDMFYTNTFANSSWICPNTADIQLNNFTAYFEADVYSCSYSKEVDDQLGHYMTPYADEDEECMDSGTIPAQLDKFYVSTMVVSDTFNP